MAVLANRRVMIGVSAVFVVATVVTGCSGGPLAGSPATSSASGGTTAPEPATTSADPETGPADSPIGRLKPCEMISERDAAANNLRGKSTTRFAGARACQFGDDETMAVVTLDDQQSIDALQAYPRTTPYTVGSRKGRQVRDALEPGTCSIAVATGARSYIEFYVKTGEDTEKACVAADSLVKAAESKLP